MLKQNKQTDLILQQTSANENLNFQDKISQKTLTPEQNQKKIEESFAVTLEKQKKQSADFIRRIQISSEFSQLLNKYLNDRFDFTKRMHSEEQLQIPLAGAEDFQKIKKFFESRSDSIAIDPEAIELLRIGLNANVTKEKKLQLLEAALNDIPKEFIYSDQLKSEIGSMAVTSGFKPLELKPLVEKFKLQLK